MSSESYPGYPECVVSCHGAGRLANSIGPIFETSVKRISLIPATLRNLTENPATERYVPCYQHLSHKAVSRIKVSFLHNWCVSETVWPSCTQRL